MLKECDFFINICYLIKHSFTIFGSIYFFFYLFKSFLIYFSMSDIRFRKLKAHYVYVLKGYVV